MTSKTAFPLATCLLAIASTALAQTILYVDDDNCPGPGTGTPADPFCTIQAGIDAAGKWRSVRGPGFSY